MRSNLVKFPIGHEASMDTPGMEARALASARLRRAICAAGLTQQAAGELVGVDARQVRRWLADPPPVLALLVGLEQPLVRTSPNLCHDLAIAGSKPAQGTEREAA